MHPAQARSLRRPRPIGMFAEQAPTPQAPAAAIVDGLYEELAGEPGIRVSDTTRASSRTYFGGELVGPQTFLRAPSGPNSPEVLDVAPVKINYRRALSRTRGA